MPERFFYDVILTSYVCRDNYDYLQFLEISHGKDSFHAIIQIEFEREIERVEVLNFNDLFCLGFPSLDNYPKLHGEPILLSEMRNNKVIFRCMFDPVEITPNVRHEVEFFEGENNRRAHNTTLQGPEREAIMENGDESKFTLGKEVYSLIFL